MSNALHYEVTVPNDPDARPSVMAIHLSEMQRELGEFFARFGYSVDETSGVMIAAPERAS